MRVVNLVVTSHDFVSGLQNCLEFSQLLSCLDEAMQTWKKSCISYIVNIASSVTVFSKKCILVSARMRSCILCSILFFQVKTLP